MPAATDTIITIDGHYVRPQRAAAYLVLDGDEAAFVDNATRFAVPDLLKTLKDQGLSPEQVRYAIVTHVHLDHSGGTAELVKHCPNATVIAHPRAGRHIVDPTRLIQSARPIYGDAFFEQYFGEIEPVDANRVRTIEEGEELPLGNRVFTVYHTPGHAKHHLVVRDSATNSMLAGDAFGLAQRRLQEGERPYLSYVCSPPDFDPAAAKDSLRKILNAGVDRVFLTHYGEFNALEEGVAQLEESHDAFDAIANSAAATDLEGQALLDYCTEKTRTQLLNEVRAVGLDPADEDVYYWATAELPVSAQGIAWLAQKRR
ncbi:MAG: MBL fold metallo-hydrolase [Candidatus Hydrogenedentales bacterium]